MFDEFKEVVTLEFKMSNICLMLYYIGIESKQIGKSIFISQEGYAKNNSQDVWHEYVQSDDTSIDYRVKVSRHVGENIDAT